MSGVRSALLFPLILLFAAIFAEGQTFSPAMPDSVPPAAGDVVEAATLRWIDSKTGTGEAAAAGKKLTVHYTGWLRNGTKFDSSVDRNEPFSFVQGRRQVIAGWDMGFEGMKVGARRRLFVPYQLAYGEKGTGPIPPKAELIFDVELLGVNDVPDLLPSAEVLDPLKEAESKVIALAKAVPEEKYKWRPGEGVRSFGEVFLHIALGNELILTIADHQPSKDALSKLIAQQAAAERIPSLKDETIARISSSFAAIRKSVEPMRAGALGREAELFGQATTKRGILIFLDTHVAEHLGQAIAYARMNGIAPPWSAESAPAK